MLGRARVQATLPFGLGAGQLFGLMAGHLAHVEDTYVTASGRKVTLRIYVEHGNEDRCDYAMDALKRSDFMDHFKGNIFLSQYEAVTTLSPKAAA